MKKIVIIGATSSIAEHCARRWVHQEPIDLTLIGRDKIKIERIAADLRVRSPESSVQALEIPANDFLAPEAIESLVNNLTKAEPIDIVLIAHGMLPEQKECQEDLLLCQKTLLVNGISPVLYAEAFARVFEKTDHGTIAVIGSVGGDRGRKANYTYGAAKGLVTRYLEGLQHRFYGTKVKIILINPGPTDTPMTIRYKEKGMKMASVESVAEDIVKAVESGKAVVYTPRIWWLIMRIVQHIPACIFNRLSI